MPKHLGREEAGLMDRKLKKSGKEESKERINQFIIECMFSKYFAEKKDSKLVMKREEIKV